MNKYLLLFFLTLIIYSCNTKQENKASDNSSTQDTLAPLQKTVTADLHDSLQARTIAMDTMPNPLTVVVPNKAGGYYSITNAEGEVSTINLEPPLHKPQAVLQNEKGEPILDSEVKPIMMGDGGKSLKITKGLPYFDIRIGVHTGPVVASIVGLKKFAYDIWGDTVNTASRMESSGEAGKVNISGTTYELVKDQFIFTHRGKIQAKGKGELDMYYVEGRI